MSTSTYKVNISVRELVEFIMRSGDLDTSKARISSKAMQEGIRLHQEIQKSMPECYQPEVRILRDNPVVYEGVEFIVALDGRADGVIMAPTTEERLDFPNNELLFLNSSVIIDEIKCMYSDVLKLDEPIKVHLAQAKCYAYMLAMDEGIKSIGIQMTYCNIDSAEIKYFTDEYEIEELTSFMDELLLEYAKWLYWEMKHKESRDESIKNLDFPFEYRTGQKELVLDVYRSILRKKKLFIEAPTGVGKTISTMYPAVKAMGEGLSSKLFYVTARTITRTVANDTAEILRNHGADILNISLTAKDKMCILEKHNCTPTACERAKGHEDRVNDAVYDLITHEKQITREVLLQYAEKHMVCPFEFSLDVSLWCDIIIGDYNYAFDPDASLKRFFNDGHLGDYTILVDEAHNLVDRAREMYSAELSKEDVLVSRHLFPEKDASVKMFTTLNRRLLNLKKQCVDDLTEIPFEQAESIFITANKLYDRLTSLISDRKVTIDSEALDFYFRLRYFVQTMTYFDDNYVLLAIKENDDFILRLNCMNPRDRLAEYYAFHRSALLFSATLLPVRYYMDQLGGDVEEDYAVYAPSSFDPDKRGIFIAGDVSAKYTRRTEAEFERIADYIITMADSKVGNYMVFFPSYKVMDQVSAYLEGRLDMVVQGSSMSEAEREEFLNCFVENPEHSKVGLCVMGGIFSEGIDLKADRLIGVAIVGTGLPMVNERTKMMQSYFDDMNNQGFEYTYLYPGMNKVLQAGGRVIRTAQDVGIILLLDERFNQSTYRKLFPREWSGAVTVNKNNVSHKLLEFWNRNSWK